MSQTTKPQVSLFDLVTEIDNEVLEFDYAEIAAQYAGRLPVAMKPEDVTITSVADNEEIKKLFWLKVKYGIENERLELLFMLTGTLPEGVTEEQAAITDYKANLYDDLFWQLARRTTGAYGQSVGIREGFVLVTPKEEPAHEHGHQGGGGPFLGALRAGGQNGLVN